MSTPDFASLSRIEEQLLAARLDAVRKSISHSGEKGRALEQQVRRLLREVLPPEYGLTTGFVVWLSPAGPLLSSQLDIIVYDAVRYGPLIHLETCDVLPLEAVYAYVEVKASLRSSSNVGSPADDSLEACVRKNAAIRQMRNRFFCVTSGSPMSVDTFSDYWLALRAYVVAFEASGAIGNDADAFASRMADALKQQGDAHGSAPQDDRFHVVYTTDHPLLAFKSLLLQGLASFRRPESNWSPALHLYFQHEPQWLEQIPGENKV